MTLAKIKTKPVGYSDSAPGSDHQAWAHGVLVFFLLLEITAPGYVKHICNLEDLTGILIIGIPLAELLFPIAFGFYTSI